MPKKAPDKEPKKDYIEFAELGRQQADLVKVGKVTADSVRRGSGKDWRQWLEILERAGAMSWPYAKIVQHLRAKHRLTPWWQHGVALGFEIATGRRREGQDAKGKYMVTATKSLAHPVRIVWQLLISEAGQAIWLQPLGKAIAPRAKTPFETTDGYFGELRTLTARRRLRLSWQDPLWSKPTTVELLCVVRPGKSTILVINHTGLASPALKDQLRLRWRAVADRLAKELGD